MNLDVNLVIGRVIDILNENLPDPITNRAGSYAFGPDQDLVFTRYMPKIQVTDRLLITPTDTMSFGQSFERDKNFLFAINFYNQRNQEYTVSGSTYKNRTMTHHFLKEIEQTIIDNQQSKGLHGLEFGDVERVPYVPEYKAYVGTLPIMAKWRVR